MLDIKFVRDNPEVVKTACRNKKVAADVDAILGLETRRRELMAQVEELNRQRNEAAKAKDIERGKEIKKNLAVAQDESERVSAELTPLLERLPNIPTEDTPVGPDESGNVVLRAWGEPTKFDFEPKDHVALGEALGVIDNERAAEVTGARFTYLKGDLVRLQYAIVLHVFSVLTSPETLAKIIAAAKLDVAAKPFVPVAPPLMIRPEVMQKMARLEPKEERYHIPGDDLYLIGSAEHTLGPLHMNETFKEADLPARYVAFTAAFRREAGSYGKDMRGILRLHQFDKVEMESFSLPEKSRAEQDLFVAIQEHLMQSLGIPYRVMQICTGDMGGPDSRQIDIEAWLPGQNKYRETHTSDLMTDYQARRLQTRVRRNAGGSEYVHMNDATAFAIGRTLIAIMENFQQADGTVRVPAVLVPFMGGKTVIGSPS